MVLISGGHYDKKGYFYSLALTLPKFRKTECDTIFKKNSKVLELSMETGFSLTTSPKHVIFLFRVLGFGIKFEMYINQGE